MQCASAATLAVEKWVELTSDPYVKKELKGMLEKISELTIVVNGGATANEYANVEHAVDAARVFAGATDASQELLEVELDVENVPSAEAERRDAVSPLRDAEFAAAPQPTTGPGTESCESPSIKQEIASPPADQRDSETLVPLSEVCCDELLEEMRFSESEVDEVRVRPGLSARAEMAEALRQLGKQHE